MMSKIPYCRIYTVHSTRVCLFLKILTSFNTPNAEQISEVNVHVHRKIAKVHIDTESVFSCPKCTFNPIPFGIRNTIWNPD